MIKEIKYTGYTARPSDYESPDGDLALSLNLIPDDGHIAPAVPPVILADLSSLAPVRLVRIHGDRLVVVGGDSPSLWFLPRLDDGAFGTPVHVRYLDDPVTRISTIGNTLILHTYDSMLYFLWKDDAYVSLGSSLPDIQLSFGLVGHPRLWSKAGGEKIELSTDIKYDWAPYGDGTFNDADKTMVTGRVMAALNRFVREQTVDKGRFCHPFFIRTALRLYDGSLVCHSAPVLMCPSTFDGPLVRFMPSTTSLGAGPGQYGLFNADIFLVAADIDYVWANPMLPATPTSPRPLDVWKDIVRSVDVFVSAPIYNYDQSGEIERFVSLSAHRSRFIGRLPGGAAPEGKIEDDRMRSYVNAGPDVASHYMEWPLSCLEQMYFNIHQDGDRTILRLPEKKDESLFSDIRDRAQFYLLHSIPLDELAYEARSRIPVADDYLQSLTSRELMTDDYLSRDAIAADFSQEFNGRLNLAGIRRRLFRGFSPASMFAYCDRLVKEFKTASSPSIGSGDLDLNASVTVTAGSVSDKVSVTVLVREGGEVRRLEADSGDIRLAPWLSPDRTGRMSWGAWLFYPNVNAYRAIIRSSSFPDHLVVDLRPHDFLNGAYAFFPFASIRNGDHDPDAIPANAKDASVPVEIPDKLFTSEINNPFFYPLTSRNTIGTGRILGIATAARALSQGQFGHFPLYAFTDSGVWALETSATGSYSAKQPITRDVCVNPAAITQIDSSVLFPTARGIMMVSGSQTQCITDVIDTPRPFDCLTLPGMRELHARLGHPADTCLPTAPFGRFLSGCGMLYDYVHQRIILFNPAHTYAYVYSFRSQAWGMIYSDIAAGVNSYPETFAVDSSGRLVDYSRDDPDARALPALLVTRPLKLDAPDILKTVDTVIQRGNFRKGHVQSALYGSRDLFNWHLVWSSRDHYLRGFSGTPYKYFRIALLTTLDPGESISGASLQFTPRLTGRPR